MTATRHVLILGAGLGGPCLALSLARQNIRSTIFEIRSGRVDSGGSISLGPNGLRVLDRYAGIYDRIKSIGYIYNRFSAYSEEGEKFGEILAGEEDKGEDGYPAVRLMRPDLNKTLLDAAEQSGMVDIKYGAKMTRIEEDDAGVTAYFEDGSNVKGASFPLALAVFLLLFVFYTSHPCWVLANHCLTGDILIGADGIHSKAREHILGTDSPEPIYSGINIVNGFLPAASVADTSADFSFPAFMFTSSGMLMTIPIDPEAKTLSWGINKVAAERTRDELREFERSGDAVRSAKSDYDGVQTPAVRALLDKADDSKSRLWAPYSIPDLPKWHSSRVCLIGDAAHALPPNGLGASIAFEDAAILTRLLTSESMGGYETIFSRFEAIRRPRIAGLRETSKKSETVKGQSGPWVWWLKKWMFRGFFWWNSGVVNFAKQTHYDVDEVNLEA
ncbi:hypothetical protein P7C73_g289, partial [Tremellales sp. Uapishka_1]